MAKTEEQTSQGPGESPAPQDEAPKGKKGKPEAEASGAKPPKEPKAPKEGKGQKEPKEPKAAKGQAPKGDKKGKKEDARPAEPARKAAPPRLRDRYRASAAAALTKRFNYTNPMQVPRVRKIVVNMGLGAAVSNPKIIDSAVEELAQITGQKPIVTRAKKAISNYKLRTGVPIGAMVTLRRETMWEFLDRLISFALPRVRDFKGVSAKGFDGRGNYTLGLREQIIFPEINYDKIDAIKGMNVSIITTAGTDEEGRALLSELGMPFRS
jgi:large subunit ribosomal protein L5